MFHNCKDLGKWFGIHLADPLGVVDRPDAILAGRVKGHAKRKILSKFCSLVDGENFHHRHTGFVFDQPEGVFQ